MPENAVNAVTESTSAATLAATVAPKSPDEAQRDYRKARESQSEMTAERAPEAKPTTSAASDQTEARTAADSETATQEDAKPGKKGIDKRFSELTRERDQARQRVEFLERQFAQQGGKTAETAAAPAKTEPAAAAADEPQIANFDSYEAYVRALTRYELKQERLEAERTAKAGKDAETAKQQADRWNARLDQARADYQDFDEVVLGAAAKLPISEAMHHAIVDSDQGADVAYFLAKNPDECARIAALSPFAAAREIGKIESKLSKAPEAAAPPEPKAKVSAAPAPITPVTARSATAAAKDPSKMSDREYRAWRERSQA